MATTRASEERILSGHEAIAAAWTRILPRTATTTQIGRGFTTSRMERILEIAFALGAALLGVQAALTAMASDLMPMARTVVTIVVFASLATMILLCAFGRAARQASLAFAIVFPLGLLALWTLPAPRFEPMGGTWPFYLVNLAPAAAAIALSIPWQIAWAAAVPVLFASIRLTRAHFSPDALLDAAYDVSLQLIIGGVVIVLVWMFRSLAAGVDAARTAAISEYSRAASAEAAEQERVEVAALMHDSVLAALIAAGRAESARERQLAVTMAREALTRLANAESDAPEGTDEPVSSRWIADELRAQAASLGVDLPLDGSGRERPGIPGRVARALVLAATQAVANAVQHADGAGLRAGVATLGARVEVVVSDAGPGVDLDAIPADRIGIRASIVARVAAVGGEARIASGDDGTRVQLVWPAHPSGAGEERA